MLLEGDTAVESQAPVVPTKHPLSVVDSEELKRKGHGLSLLSTESDDPRPPPIGARSAASSLALRCSVLPFPPPVLPTFLFFFGAEASAPPPSSRRARRRAKSRSQLADRCPTRPLRWLTEAIALRATDHLHLRDGLSAGARGCLGRAESAGAPDQWKPIRRRLRWGRLCVAGAQ